MLTTTSRRVTVLIATATLLSAGLAAGLAPTAGAATVGDEAAFTAAWEASGTTAIDLGADITLTCASGEPTRDAASAIVVNGNGHTLTQTCDGSRVLEQHEEGAVTLDGVTITGGSGGGGAGLDTAGDVTVTDSVFTGNATADDEGGAIQSLGAVTITGSLFTDNQSGGSGGAVAAQGLITLTSSTVSGNTSGNNGGGFRAYGGATVVNSTMTGNVASGGGAIDSNTDVTLVYATITANSGAAGVEGDGTLSAFASAVAQPTVGPNCVGFSATTSNGYDIDDDGSCGFGSGAGDHSDFATALQLGALGDNGGPTPTQLPAGASPLVNAVPTASCQADGASGITTDQRSITRPQASGCDIGAVEVAVSVPSTTTTTTTGSPSTAPTAVEATPAFTG